MKNQEFNHGEWEEHIQDMGQQMVFPPTPDIASSVRAKLAQPQKQSISVRGLVGIGAGMAVMVLVILLLVPDVRATALEFFRIGLVEFDYGIPHI